MEVSINRQIEQAFQDLAVAIEAAKERLDVRCGLWFDIVWYRQERHNVRMRWKRKNGMYKPR